MPVAFDEVVEKITDVSRHDEADGGASPVPVCHRQGSSRRNCEKTGARPMACPVATP